MFMRNPRPGQEAEGSRIRERRNWTRAAGPVQLSWDAGSAAWWELGDSNAHPITVISPGVKTA